MGYVFLVKNHNPLVVVFYSLLISASCLSSVSDNFRLKGTVVKIQGNQILFRVNGKLLKVPRNSFDEPEDIRENCICFANFEGSAFDSEIIRNSASELKKK
jgi:hypothetical protein